jgi:hypothetical protein
MSFEPRHENFFIDQTVSRASVILSWPWSLPADDFAFPDTVDADRRFFTENPHRNYRLRFASQLECAMWRQKTGQLVPNDMFLYCVIRCTASSYTMRYRIAERFGAIEDNTDSVARIVFEGH